MNWNMFRGYLWKNSKYLFIFTAMVVVGMMLSSSSQTSTIVVEAEYKEVLVFLEADSTDTNPYLGNDIYDCEDFAMDTQIRANRHGIACAYVLINTIKQDGNTLHAVVAFRVNDTTIFFEPQSDDQIFPRSSSIYSLTWEPGEYLPARGEEL